MAKNPDSVPSAVTIPIDILHPLITALKKLGIPLQYIIAPDDAIIVATTVLTHPFDYATRIVEQIEARHSAYTFSMIPFVDNFVPGTKLKPRNDRREVTNYQFQNADMNASFPPVSRSRRRSGHKMTVYMPENMNLSLSTCDESTSSSTSSLPSPSTPSPHQADSMTFDRLPDNFFG
jgi:hypothetical protein